MEVLMMKKVFVTVTTIAILTMSIGAVSAAETVQPAQQVQETYRSNMDAETFLNLRLEQLKEAFDRGLMTQEQYDLMVEHMTETTEAGVYGRGPNGHEMYDDCILGEDGQGHMFRNTTDNGINTNKATYGYGRGAGHGRGHGQNASYCH